jgi:5-methylcytosine-specific restriction protein A
MAKRPPVFRPRTARTKQQRDHAADRRRGSARQRGYSPAWDKASKGHLCHHPLCAYCALNGRVEPATLTDHLYPHQVYDWVFWLTKWWVSSCAECHNGFKQAIERQGKPALDALARRLAREVMPNTRPSPEG